MSSDPGTGTRASATSAEAPVEWVAPPPGPPTYPTEWPPLPAEPPPDQPARRRRFPFAPRTLTARLVTGVVALVVVLVLATGIGTYYSLSSYLNNRLDQQVRSAVSTASLNELFSGGDPFPTTGLRAPQQIWATALDPTSNQVFVEPRKGFAEAMQLSASDRSFLAAHANVTRTIRTVDGHELRVTTRNVLVNQTIPVTAVVGLSTSEVNHTLRRLLELELLIGAVAVALALAATTYGVRYSLRHLYGVTRTARQVAAELSPQGTGLDRRVDVAEPESEVGQVAESMNTLLSAVETQFAARIASEDRMRQFLADASHELRTPLTSIRGYAELARMQKQHGGEGEDNLARIESEGTRMSRLVDDLLTLARNDQGTEPHREIIDFSDLVDEAVAGVRAAHPQRTIGFDAPGEVSVIGDRDQLMRVVLNLVTNAAVHTRPDGPIRVSVTTEGADAVLRVVDSGPGLNTEDAAKVFERFWRADKARSRARGGSGLGMAIVASIIWAHGGSVDFRSTIETGSTVTVRLPRAMS
ncbi:MAG TPA: HAMP domain-containing sensor histidine kinase [Jatrophihabitantaceae bacterium]|nr:HAMP domain-containing sensor histidine kinase [Jatrophihabitantaceae bacterium]